MNVLIAEDELIERKSMKKFIEENFSKIKVVGEAVNGREAIEKTQTLQPDVILMDVKMPGIDGIEAVRQINEQYPSVKFIMVSAYDSFDYAKEAMSYGIKDYILKPGKKEEIIRALLRLKKELLEDEEREIEQQQSRSWKEEKWLKKLMQQSAGKETDALRKELFPAMKSCYFLVFMQETSYLLETIRNALQQNLTHPFVLLDEDSYTAAAIIIQKEMGDPDILKTAQLLHYTLGEGTYIGAGNVYTTQEKMVQSFSEAYAACFHLKTNQQRAYGFLAETYQDRGAILSKIYTSIEKGNGAEAAAYFKEKQSLLSDKDKEQLYVQLQHLLEEHNVSASFPSMSALNTVDDWYHYLHMFGNQLHESYQANQSLNQIKNYLRNHFNEPLTLEEAAFRIQLSPNYFSNLFKQTFQMNFTEYVTKLRMEEAKTLIKENEHTLKEVSYLVGYKDPNYFSRVFKKYFQQSPKQFQQEIFKK